jgi:hypothetical protein
VPTFACFHAMQQHIERKADKVVANNHISIVRNNLSPHTCESRKNNNNNTTMLRIRTCAKRKQSSARSFVTTRNARRPLAAAALHMNYEYNNNNNNNNTRCERLPGVCRNFEIVWQRHAVELAQRTKRRVVARLPTTTDDDNNT